MNRDELMQLAAEKAIGEISWESIEYLFQPSNFLQLMLRLDYAGMIDKLNQTLADDSPTAMPFRFRRHYMPMITEAIETEKFYKKLQALHDQPHNTINSSRS